MLECDHEPNSFEESDALKVVENLTAELLDQLNEILPRGFKAVER
jgi:hypothetical protein